MCENRLVLHSSSEHHHSLHERELENEGNTQLPCRQLMNHYYNSFEQSWRVKMIDNKINQLENYRLSHW